MCCAVRCLSFPRYTFMSRVSSRITKFENFDAKMLVFLWYVLFENHPLFEGNNNFVKSQIFRRVVKFGKCVSKNLKQVLYLPVCQNFHLSYQVHSCCHQNVSNEGCEVIGPGDYQCQQSVQILRWPAVTAASCFSDSFYTNMHTIIKC